MNKPASKRSQGSTRARTWTLLGFVSMAAGCAGAESVSARTVSTERLGEQAARAERASYGDITALTWQAVPTEREGEQAWRAERTIQTAELGAACIPWRQPVATERHPERVARAERQISQVERSSRTDPECL
jgi:hypothetical protein